MVIPADLDDDHHHVHGVSVPTDQNSKEINKIEYGFESNMGQKYE